jgi:hypothetical protein
VSNGENAAKSTMGAGYKKAMTGSYYAELYNASPIAPPDAGLPWTIGDYTDNPLIDDPPSPPPPAPDRCLRGLSTCESCGATFGFSRTDAATCPNCTDAQTITNGLTAPGTPWF